MKKLQPISPSILAADFANLEQEVNDTLIVGADPLFFPGNDNITLPIEP
jgi:pentose-5-phosphate-3-epimerase